MKKRVMLCCLCLLCYGAVFFLCEQFFFIGREAHLYTPDWTAKNILWIAALLSSIPALFGKTAFPFITFGGYAAGVLLGEAFGAAERTVSSPGEGLTMPVHYGWLICIAVYLVFCGLGILVESRKAKKRRLP